MAKARKPARHGREAKGLGGMGAEAKKSPLRRKPRYKMYWAPETKSSKKRKAARKGTYNRRSPAKKSSSWGSKIKSAFKKAGR